MIYAERNGKVSNKSIRNIVHYCERAYVEVNSCEICQMENQFSIEDGCYKIVEIHGRCAFESKSMCIYIEAFHKLIFRNY